MALKFESVNSSSSGNLYIIKEGEFNNSPQLLIECGIPYKNIEKALGYDIMNVVGCLVSHEHKDHSKSFRALLDNGIDVYSSKGTKEVLNDVRIKDMKAKTIYRISDFYVLAIDVFHDCNEPFGFLIWDNVDKLLFITDTANCGYIFDDITIIAIECNYIDSILQESLLNEKVKARIKHNHFELEKCIAYLKKLDLSKCRAIYLLHLSDLQSNEMYMKNLFLREFPGIEIHICKK
jgi:phosphoribosyl 1,2-cyclic phosphodiesterase